MSDAILNPRTCWRGSGQQAGFWCSKTKHSVLKVSSNWFSADAEKQQTFVRSDLYNMLQSKPLGIRGELDAVSDLLDANSFGLTSKCCRCIWNMHFIHLQYKVLSCVRQLVSFSRKKSCMCQTGIYCSHCVISYLARIS